MAVGRRLLRKGLSVEPDQRVDASGVAYLGYKVEKTSAKLAEGRLATVVAYDMEEFIKSRAARYSELSGNARAREFA
eukprot:13911925-Alexandrium_andersonii.AAC.1